MAAGLEGQISSLDRQDVPGSLAPLVVGDGAEASLWLGGKWTAPLGAAVTKMVPTSSPWYSKAVKLLSASSGGGSDDDE